jgi:purine nucleosidase
MRIVLDTDIGTDADDAVALALLLASPEIELEGVTTVSGDVDLRARIARKLLALGGRADVPVHSGCSQPLGRNGNFFWLGHEGRGIVLPDDPVSTVPGDGVSRLARSGAHILAIGPLTNVAAALRDAPERQAGLTLMGGALGIADDPTTPSVEYNLGSDAEASVAVLSSGVAATIVPLDVTWQVRLLEPHLARLRRSRSMLVQVVCDAMEIWWSVHREWFAGRRTYGADVVCFLHDPLALSVPIDPSFVTLEAVRIIPEVVDGMFRLRRSDEGREFRVATKVDAPGFAEFVVERLMRLR